MKFEYDWLDAPGVRDRVLAASWARLRICVADSDVTELLHVDSDTRRSSVYGPVFPLVDWMVENWWHLLHEPSPTSPLKPGRGAPAWERDWVQRHNLLAAREGAALPDALFVRDGDDVVVRWFPDSPEQRRGRVRFLGDGHVRIQARELERAAAAFIDSVLIRLREVVGEDEDLQRVVAAWREIRTADAVEQELCRAFAILGVDPYDSEEASDALVDRILRLRDELPADLLNDLLEGTDSVSLPDASDWVTSKKDSLANGGPHPAYPTLPAAWAPSAHQTGYQLARRVRTELLKVSQEEPLQDLDSLLRDRLRWDPKLREPVDPVKTLDGLVGLAKGSERPVLIVPGKRDRCGERFRLARAAFFTTMGSIGRGRLLTGAVTRPQRAGRAFAAELLAPSAALARRVSGRIGDQELSDLSEDFGVSPLLIQHQIENHGLGAVEA